MIIDTHCHLTDEAFTADVEACIVNAKEAGVQRIMLACCDETEFPLILDLSRRHPGMFYQSIGIHPENLSIDLPTQLGKIRQLLEAHHDQIQAIGEIGIDLYWDKSRFDDQCVALEQQMAWALEYDLPVLMHIREAMPQFLEFMRTRIYNMCNAQGRRLRGILHCYNGTADEAEQTLQYGDFLFGIGGTITYKKSKVPEVAKAIGLQRIVLETDAPYLSPVPHRGKRNEPAYTALTAQFLAELLGASREEVEEVTTANALRLFEQ